MTVLLTGATGFLGSHVLVRLLADGHRVRAYVRKPDTLWPVLSQWGLEPDDERIEVSGGDMTDADTVANALDGCEAVVHAAATYSYLRRDAEAMQRENAAGTRAVLEAARAAGCAYAVHVSSAVALNRPGGGTIGPSSDLGPGLGPYSASKVASERIARELRDAGLPVGIVHPGAVIGPHDPRLGETNEVLRNALNGRLPVWPRGGLHFVDVRESAAVVGAMVQERRAERFAVPGAFLASPHAMLGEVTGRRLRHLTLPVSVAVAGTLPGYLTGWSWLPGGTEGARVIGCDNRVDAKTSEQLLGVTARPVADSLRDTVTWMAATGVVSSRAAGACAS